MDQRCLRKASFDFHMKMTFGQGQNDLDLEYSHTFINSISCLLLPTFMLQAAIYFEKSKVFTFSYRKSYFTKSVLVAKWVMVNEGLSFILTL